MQKFYLYSWSYEYNRRQKKATSEKIAKLVKKIKTYTNILVAVGFGIKTKEDIKDMKNISDRAIVGTRVVEICEDYPKNSLEKINELFG